MRRTLAALALRTALVTLLSLVLLPAVLAQTPNAITLLYFRATAQADSVYLKWETGAEIDHGGFQLFRSTIPNDPTRGASLGDFAPRGDVGGAVYEYTDTAVTIGTTYYYTLLSFDLGGNETAYTSDPPAVTPGQVQPTATPTVPATATPTVAPTTTSPTAVAPTNTPPPAPTNTAPPASAPTSAPGGPAFVTATPTAITAQPAPTATPVPPPAAPLPTDTPASQPVEPPTNLDEVASPTPETQLPADTPVAAQPTSEVLPTEPPQAPATPDSLGLAQGAQPTLETAAPIAAPTRALRATPRPTPDASGNSPRTLFAVIAAIALAAAALLLGLIVVLWLRMRGGQGQ